jgi:hypothetical protein
MGMDLTSGLCLPGLFPLPPTRPASVVPGLSTSAPRRGYNGDQGRCPERVTPQLRLRSRRCTSAHTKAPPDGPGSQRPGPGSSRRRPAAAGRLHRYAPITPPNGKHAGLRRRRGPVLPCLHSVALRSQTFLATPLLTLNVAGEICLGKRSVQLRLSSSVQSVARPSYSRVKSSFLSGILRKRYSSVLRSPQSR